MKNGTYETRKEQIEREFLRRLIRLLKVEGVVINARARLHIKDALMSAAFVAACEERDRTLRLLADRGHSGDGEMSGQITSKAVLDVLGYPRNPNVKEKQKSK